MADTISDKERADLLNSAPNALATDTLSDLRLKQYKTATPGLLSIADFEKRSLETAISTEDVRDTIYSLRRKYYTEIQGVSGVGRSTDDMHYEMYSIG